MPGETRSAPLTGKSSRVISTKVCTGSVPGALLVTQPSSYGPYPQGRGSVMLPILPYPMNAPFMPCRMRQPGTGCRLTAKPPLPGRCPTLAELMQFCPLDQFVLAVSPVYLRAIENDILAGLPAPGSD
jgi:hypothetical protein